MPIRKRLRSLVEVRSTIIVAGAFNTLSAKVIVVLGF